jgi:aldose 1-epimerase
MAIDCRPFGTTHDGIHVDLYTLTNRNGLKARIASYGATLVSLEVPDRRGTPADVVLGFDTLEPYLDVHPYFGSIIGRYANRIRNGRFVLHGKSYALPCNDGPNHLHGGPRGFHTMHWRASPGVSDEGPQLELQYRSAHGEQGYPGKLDVRVAYTLTDRDELRIEYEAQTDAATIVNLTNHAYFNLAGGGTILGHELAIRAERFLPVDDTLIPTGEFRSVGGTPFDFTSAKRIADGMQRPDAQLAITGGYDHNWVLDTARSPAAFAGTLHDPQSGRTMKVFTTQPGVQIYSGNFLDGTLRGKGGACYQKHAALCFETQHFPDSPNRPPFPSTVLEPDSVFRQSTVYAFSAT